MIIEHEENDNSFMKTIPPDSDMNMVVYECCVGIEGDENRLEGIGQLFDIFSDMSLSNSDKKCGAV